MTENSSNINVDKIVKHWIETSEEDYQTMLTLFNSKNIVGHYFQDIFQ